MDAQAALGELMELSAQVDRAAILDEGDVVLASSEEQPAAADSLARAALELLAAAADVRPGGPAVTRLEVALPEGSVFVVREGASTVVAATASEPTSGLVLYDLRTCARRIVEEPPARPARRRRARAAEDAGA